MRELSTHPKSIKSRAWYQKHKNDPSLRMKVNRTRLILRDTESFRKKRSEIMARYRLDPVQRLKMINQVERWIKKNPEKAEAHRLVRNALRSGEVVRASSCTKCGIIPPRGRKGKDLLHAHHEDYSKPLDVQWLCSVCHGRERRFT